MDSSLELKILSKCREQVVSTIRNNLEEIAGHLYEKDVITFEIYREATDTTISHCTDNEIAKTILRRLQDKVQEDSKYYYIFYSYLESKKVYSKTTALMSEGRVVLNRKGK